MEDTALSVIQGAVSGLSADAIAVITAALSLGVIFFGAKLLWNKFRSMAK